MVSELCHELDITASETIKWYKNVPACHLQIIINNKSFPEIIQFIHYLWTV